jgi:hypothetical protein
VFWRSTPTAPPVPTSPSPSASLCQHARLEGYVYCAARNVQRLAQLATTPEDADHILCALANLEQIARATASPARDLHEIECWRMEAERRVEAVRTPRTTVQIAPEFIEKRRVPA